MQTKLFEVRDRGTFISVLAVRLTGGVLIGDYVAHDQECWLMRRCGYSLEQTNIMVTYLDGGRVATCDPHGHIGSGPRTLPVAHKFILEQWDHLESGEVIDVEYILGETTVKKESERHG